MKSWILVALVACRHGSDDTFPYQPNEDDDGGYYNRDLGNGMIEVGVLGNENASMITVRAYVLRRADELCPLGYDILDASDESMVTTTTRAHAFGFGNGAFARAKTETTTRPQIVIAIRCRGRCQRPSCD